MAGMSDYPGDFTGVPTMQWAPTPEDPMPSPGEVVWAWVPYEEDHAQGKDRPVLALCVVLLVGHPGPDDLAGGGHRVLGGRGPLHRRYAGEVAGVVAHAGHASAPA